MTVSSTTTKNSYSGDGSNAVFAYTFKVFDEDDLTVILRTDATGTETVQTITTNYTVSGVGDAGGGNVTFVTPPASGVTVVIRRAAAITQTTDYTPNDPFPAEEHENALDKLTFIAQQQQEELDRAIKLSRTNTMTSTEFTVGSTDRANKILAFDGTGELSVTQELGVFRGDWAADTAFAVRDLIKDTTNDNIYICQTAHTSSGSLPISTNTDSSKWELIVDAATATTSATAAAASAAAAATSEANAATSETNAATSETNAAASEAGVAADASAAAASASAAAASETAAAASETAAAASETAAAASETAAASSASSASTSASTATTKAAEASTSATNAATSETNAASSASAAATSASNASTSETNAATSASAASTSASNAATSETNAATSASNAATSESNASTSETNAAASATSASTSASTATTKAAEAATSASNAATSETNAATSETNAATSASNAASSATAAASSASSASSAQTAAESARDATLAAYDNFDDRYLGAKSSAPTVDNDGNALVAGALYFDTVAGAMYVYTGSAWVAAYVSGTGFLALTGGTMTGTITFDAAQTFDGRDVSADGAKLDGIEAGATADQTKADIDALGINAATLDSIDSTQFLRSDAADTKTAGDLSFSDNVKAVFGASGNLEIFHDGTHNYIQDTTTGNLYIQGTNLILKSQGGTENLADFVTNGAVTLYYDNAAKLATTSSGIDVTGTVTFDGGTTSADLNFGDNDKAVFGAGNDLKIYHDGSNSYVQEGGTGSLYLLGQSQVVIGKSDASATYAAFNNTGSVDLYFNNAKKLATKTDGVDITGELQSDSLDVDGNADIAGTLAVGGHIDVPDNIKMRFGAGDDLQIYHDGSNSYVLDNGTGNLILRGSSQIKIQSLLGEDCAIFNENGSSSLQYDNATKLATTSSGVTVTGQLNADGLALGDNETAYFGASGDLQIYHTGSHSFIRDNGTGSLYIDATQLNFRNGAQTATYADFTNGGAARLMHNGNVKFETTSSGISVTGTVAATSFTGDGSSLTGIAAGATGGGSDEIFWENGQTVTSNYTITNGKNAMSAGPITINTGVTVTVGTGETWTVV